MGYSTNYYSLTVSLTVKLVDSIFSTQILHSMYFMLPIIIQEITQNKLTETTSNTVATN